MKTQFRFLSFLIFASFLCLTACEKDPEYKNILVNDEQANIDMNSGFVDKEVQLTSDSWKVVYVRNINPTQYLLDNKLQLMRLQEIGKVECSLGFLSLEKKAGSTNKLFISMTENFRDEPRRILIGLQIADQVKEIVITQKKGAEYELSNKIVEEIYGTHKAWTQQLNRTTIDNNASTEVKILTPIKEFFKDAAFSSTFQSDAIGSFDWSPAPDSLISMIALEHEGVKYWDDKVKYVQGPQTSAYLKDANQAINKIIPPYSKMTVYGEVTYVSRECKYTFEIKNKSTGFKTILNGKWKQNVPIKSEIKII